MQAMSSDEAVDWRQLLASLDESNKGVSMPPCT